MMDVNKTRMKPPTGAGSGLPFTWLFDPLGNWAYSPLTPTSASGTLIQPSGVNWAQKELSNPKGAYFSSSAHNDMALINTQAPRLNIGNGYMYFGQGMAQSSAPYNEDPLEKANYVSNTAATFTSPGKFTAHRDNARPAGSAESPGNYSYHNWMPSVSTPVGDVKFRTTDARVGTLGHCATVCTYSAADISSAGWGRSWGDAHDTVHNVNIGASFITQADATGLGYGTQRTRVGIAGDGLPLYWTLNSDSNTHYSDTTLTGGNPSAALERTATGAVSGASNTLAHFAFMDLDGGASRSTMPIGAPHLGNTVIADSCGLVGWDGLFVATATYANSSDDNATLTGAAGEFGYCSINIIVHTAEPGIRSQDQLAKFSASKFMIPHGDMMATNCGMLQGASRSANWDNATTLMSGITVLNATATGYLAGRTITTPGAYTEGAYYTQRSAAASEPGEITRIVGEAGVQKGTAWGGCASIDLMWAADKYPTQVRVVPSLLGKDASGSGIVDYHVLVSLATSPAPIVGGLNAAFSGDPVQRNNPAPSTLHRNVDMNGENCEIWHGVFRINPTYEAGSSTGLNAGVLKQTTAWGLHQVTPFRPLANAGWVNVPQMCSAIESGGPHQRGGIAHLWDSDAYSGELFVGADIAVPGDIHADSPSGTDSNGFNLFGAFGSGQNYNTGIEAGIGIPRQQQLMVFRYSPRTDPWHPGSKQTTPTTNKLGEWLAANAPTLTDKDAVFNASVHHVAHTVTDINLLGSRGWEIHDWVFPSGELLPYMGTGLPTIHCASLRIVDDGRMLMATIQRDYVKDAGTIPQLDIGWPYNPDIMFDVLPPGYYTDASGVVQPFGTGSSYNRDDGAGNAFVPQAGTYLTGATTPSLTQADPLSFSGMDTVFGYTPPWNKTKSDTHARSLVLMFTEAKAQHDGTCARGRAMFDVDYIREAGAWNVIQSWTGDDTWWSGSQIAYWYPESGQRAIPITYGSYPECRLSYAHLPRCLPYLDNTGQMRNGFPLLQPILAVEPGFDMTIEQTMTGTGTGSGVNDVRTDGWWKDHWDFLTINRFVATTIGFTDYGPGANPWQEFGWSGWSFPADLYQPLSTVFLTCFNDGDTLNQQNAPWGAFGWATRSSPTLWMIGPQSALSHHGPLHWGLSENTHPFITDRVWKQVNAGMGYDVPLHLLKPGAVRVRARPGGQNSLDLEMETPFHITDVQHIAGVQEFYDRNSQSYAKGVEPKPGAARPALGQFYLRTNLWSMPSASTKLPDVGNDELRGPRISGSGFIAESLASVWSDHPTEHFHAGAMPVLPGSDIDYAYLTTNRYPMPLLAKSNEMNPLDAMVQSEQLQSSVDVHVQKSVLPVWDSGGIVSGRKTGDSDTRTNYYRNFANANPMNIASPTTNDYCLDSQGVGYGQRILRTPDGTLHRFVIEQSAGWENLAGDWDLCIRHYTKPVFSDLFWNRRAVTAYLPAAPVRLKDEIPLTYLNSAATKLAGFAATCDSTGRIHLAIEIEVGGVRNCYHVYADSHQESYNPEPVWSWDWSGTIGKQLMAAGSGTLYCSQPDIAVDSNDILHATFIWQLNYSTGDRNNVVYCNTRSSSATWTFDGTFGNENQQVNKHGLFPNLPANPERCLWCHAPRLHLTSDNVPVIVWGGYDQEAITDRANHAVWANMATVTQSQYTFSEDDGCVILGMQDTSSNWTPVAGWKGIQYWDSIIDNNEMVHVVGSINYGPAAAPLPKMVIYEARTFRTDSTPRSQFNINYGVGPSIVIMDWYSGASRTPEPNWTQISLTCDHNNTIHAVVCMEHYTTSPDQQDTAFQGATDRAQGPNDKTAYPLDYPGTPSPDANAYDKSDESENVGLFEPSSPGAISTVQSSHLIELWWPAYEISTTATGGTSGVLRSLNMRWLSVPGLSWDKESGWTPVSNADSGAGSEDFPHLYPQLRYQKHHGYSSDMDLTWQTDMLAVYQTQYSGSGLYFWNGGI